MFPGWVLTGESLHILASDNIPMLIALGKDPMVIKGARVDTLYGLVDLMDRTIEAAPRLKAPTLLLYGAHDAVIPADPVRAFVAATAARTGCAATASAITRTATTCCCATSKARGSPTDVAAWVLDRAAALPSHADAIGADRPWPPVATGGRAAAVAAQHCDKRGDLRPQLRGARRANPCGGADP